MPPVPKGGAFELDIFPMGILLVLSVGRRGGEERQMNDFYLLIVNTAVLTLNLCYCIHVAIFLFTAAVFISSSK